MSKNYREEKKLYDIYILITHTVPLCLGISANPFSADARRFSVIQPNVNSCASNISEVTPR